jgi:NAD-dependent deacetylase
LVTTSSSALIHQSAELILNAQHVVVLTGAGISTPSGIPDFRSRDSGLWERYDPMAVASLTSFRYNPEDFFEWVAPLVRRIVEAQPNTAHIALAELESKGHVQAIITQNIDALHHRAGSKSVFEIHGHLREACCTSCFKTYETHDLIRSFLEDGSLPRCLECNGILKPNIVLYGEQLPADIVRAALETLEKADLILVAGSSMEVTPAATFPIAALNRGAKMIIINHEPTYLDERASVIFNEDVAVILPKIAEEVLRDEK